ncbi:ABC transporter ATP-binding protein [Methanobrevibacter sp. OttesenSCG-928-K11]|nr:ABC transporter ATP-binding protein [Methanobrevibacter sp. OttesenSCG-928-K11]MDL2270323.1 ABC transporter ATP-binding protein [Methanobrevibacter sp. OttesenSCG-928-I08]
MSIEIKNINKTYESHGKKTTVLKDINLDVNDGELVCLLGPSGCGKTTLLRLIAGLENADSGEIYDDGKLVQGPSRDRGFIFQQYSLFPWLTVLDNVMFGLNLSDNSKEENLKAAKRYLERVGLGDVADSYPHELSGGMKQRVAIIRSLLNHTPVLLMDEPFSALDIQNRHKLQEQLIGVWKRFENTIVFVTHDVDEAVYLADKVVVMEKNPGRIKEIVDITLPRIRNRESVEFIKVQNEVKELLDVWD